MKGHAAFGRAAAMMAAISAIMARTSSTAMQRSQIAALGPYKSRGKGEGRSNRRAPGAGMAAHRAAMKKRNVMRFRKTTR